MLVDLTGASHIPAMAGTSFVVPLNNALLSYECYECVDVQATRDAVQCAGQEDACGRARVVKPPEDIVVVGKCVFLAGSIEQGKAIDWQR
jgi:hypothetical protein